MIAKIVYFLIILILIFIIFLDVRAAVIGVKAKKNKILQKILLK